MQPEQTRKNPFFRSMFIYFICLVIAGTAMGLLLFRFAVREIERQSISTTIGSLEHASDLIDRRIAELDFVLGHVLQNNNIRRIAALPGDPFETNDILEMIQSKNNLDKVQLQNKMVYNYFVAFSNGVAISPDNIFKLREFYDAYFGYGDAYYESWREDVFSARYAKEFVRFPADDAVRQKPYLCYATTITAAGGHPCVLFIFIDRNQFMSLLNWNAAGPDDYLYISDMEGNVLADRNLPEDGALDSALFSERSGYHTLDGQRFAIWAASSATGLRIVSVSSDEAILTQAEGIGRVLIAIICLFVLVGLIFVLVTSYRLSKPLGEALAALSGGTKASGAPQRNQFSALKHSAAQMAGQNCALRESLEQQNALLKGIYFERLLQGKLATEEAQRRAGTLLSFPPDGKYFCAGLIALTGETPAADAVAGGRVLEMLAYLEHIRTKLWFRCQIFDEDRIVAVFIDGDAAPEPERERIAADIDVITQTLLEGGFSQRIFMGSIVDDMSKLGHSFEQAAYLCDACRVPQDFSPVVWPDDGAGAETTYDAVPADALISAILGGNSVQIEKTIDLILAQNRRSALLKVRVYEVLSCVLRACSLLGVESEPFLGTVNARLEEFPPDYPFILRHDLKEQMLFLAALAGERKRDGASALITRVCAYLEAHYCESGIGLTQTALAFDRSEAYISQLFKEKCGENFSDYLEKLKIAQAKKLLAGGRMTIYEVAEATGYNSSTAFGRAFKRITGMKPSEYRGTHREAGEKI